MSDMIVRADGTCILPTGGDPATERVEGYQRYWLGCDLGQKQDPTAVIVIKDYAHPEWQNARQVLGKRHRVIVYADHFIGYSYPDIVSHLIRTMTREPLRNSVQLVIDATGLGRVISDLLQEARVEHIAMQSTVGQNWSRKGRYVNVGKHAMIENLSILFSSSDLTFAKDLPLRDHIMSELETFQLEMTNAGLPIITQGRRGQHHGDLSIATAVAAFASQYLVPQKIGVMRLVGVY